MRGLARASRWALAGLVAALLCGAIAAVAQEPRQRALLEAQALERLGNWEGAYRAYLALVGEGTLNIAILQGLERVAGRAGRQQDWLAFLEERLAQTPVEPMLVLPYLSALLGAGRGDELLEAARRLLPRFPGRQDLYQGAGALLLSAGRHEEARAIYLLAREQLGDADLFARELGSVELLLGHYRESARSYLVALRAPLRPRGVAQIEGKLLEILEKWHERDLLDLLSEEAQRPGAPAQIRKVWADLLLARGRAGEAWEALRSNLQSLPEGERIREGRRFAQGCEGLGAYEAAIAALEEVRAGARGEVPGVELDLARLEALAGRPERAQQRYESLLRQSLPGEVRQQVLEALGDLALTVQGDPQKALQWYRLWGEEGGAKESLLTAKGKVAQALLHGGDWGGAREVYREIRADEEAGDERLEAAYFLGILSLAEGEVDEARGALREVVSGDPSSAWANEALEGLRILALDEQEGAPVARDFARALVLQRSGKGEEAVSTVRRVLAEAPSSPLLPDLLYLVGDLHRDLGSAPEALAAYQDLVSRYPDHRLAPFAELEIATLYLTVLGDRNAARAHFERVVLKYPENLATPRAREALKQLEEEPTP